MTSLLAKLPPKLQVELESIRRRLAAPFARFSVQKIFNEHADSIAKILALRFTHEELASILFELGLAGEDGKPLKTNTISRSLNRLRSKQAVKLPTGAGADPDSIQKSPASPLTHPEANGAETVSPTTGDRLHGHLLHVAVSAPAESFIETDQNIDGGRQGTAPCRVQCCPQCPGRLRAIEPIDASRRQTDLTDLGADRQVTASMDKARQVTAGQDKIYHGSVRQGPASLDKTRHDPANLGADDRHWECQAIRPASAIDANGAVGCIKPAIGIGAAIPHAAQAQFPIPPPNSLTANFIRALHSGGLLSKIREV